MHAAIPAIISSEKALIRANLPSALIALSPPLSSTGANRHIYFHALTYGVKRKALPRNGAWNDMRRPYFSHFSIKTRSVAYPSCLLRDITFHLNIYALPEHGSTGELTRSLLCEKLGSRDVGLCTRVHECTSTRVFNTPEAISGNNLVTRYTGARRWEENSLSLILSLAGEVIS